MARSATGILLILLCFLCKGYSQSTCPPNLDFEAGTFDHWDCFVGTVDTINGKNRMLLNPSLPINNRHTIIDATTNPGNDPYGKFPKVCPYGGRYSVRLGNDQIGAECESISYTMVVPNTVDTFTFTYFYAVVLEDPGHSLPEQPRFYVTAYDVITGDLINCASYDYVSTAGLPGFTPSSSNSGVIYKAWTPTSLQFAGLGGHTVRLEFRTADCTRSGHFGYAYLDVASACSNILATAPYCIETNSLILNAPYGFKNYTWYNSSFTSVMGNAQSVTLSPPPTTVGVFYVDVEPYPGFGCRDTLQAYVQPLPVPDTPDAAPVKLCQFSYPNQLTASVDPGNTLLWYPTATGGTGSFTAPYPSTTTAGLSKYYVSQKALFGCEGFRREVLVNVYPSPVTSFSINNIKQCQDGNNFVFTGTSSNLQNPSYVWDFGNGKTDTTLNTSSTTSYSTYGYFNVKLKTTNEGTCTTEQTQQVTIVPRPVAAFTFPGPICENQTSFTLTDQSTVPANMSTIKNWWWNINGNIVTAKTPPATTAPPGPYPVKLVVATPEGCLSDTTLNTLNIHYRPLAEFRVGDLMCTNETISFTDSSKMPPNGRAEIINKWYWTFDNTITTNTQNVNTWLTPGVHKAKLVAETTIGCKSLPVEHSFDIWPKPNVTLDISDSCVDVPVTYTATDHDGNVAKYNWYFLNGKKESTAYILTRYYKNEEDFPFTLITLTDKGCKDTIYRPFRIYDNKSWIGNDTLVAFNEPVYLSAHGAPGMQYTWTPAVGLDSPNVEKPIAIWDKDQLYQLYTVTDRGCKKTSHVKINRFAGPDLYVPNAFTPNNDGHNDQLRVKPIGIRSFDYFAVYNRWGQLVFKTTDYKIGWDGTFRGERLVQETFVYIAQATDYKGRPLVRKGTVILLR